MTKTHVNLSIDSDTIKQAKERNINLSAVAGVAIKQKLGQKEVDINTEIKACEFCSKEMRKATPGNLNGLTWLFPDEKWICPECLSLANRGYAE